MGHLFSWAWPCADGGAALVAEVVVAARAAAHAGTRGKGFVAVRAQVSVKYLVLVCLIIVVNTMFFLS